MSLWAEDVTIYWRYPHRLAPNHLKVDKTYNAIDCFVRIPKKIPSKKQEEKSEGDAPAEPWMRNPGSSGDSPSGFLLFKFLGITQTGASKDRILLLKAIGLFDPPKSPLLSYSPSISLWYGTIKQTSDSLYRGASASSRCVICVRVHYTAYPKASCHKGTKHGEAIRHGTGKNILQTGKEWVGWSRGRVSVFVWRKLNELTHRLESRCSPEYSAGVRYPLFFQFIISETW